jgi:hypothetical protein
VNFNLTFVCLTFHSLDARKRAAVKAAEIKRLADEKQKIREQELEAQAAADKQRLEAFMSKQLETSNLIQEQDRALQQILSDKERRHREDEEALARRSAAMVMAKENKAKKAELKRQRAIEAAKLKVEARSVELLEKAKKKEELARAQALLDKEAFEYDQAREAEEMLKVEEAFTDMQLELERIEMSAKAAATKASQPLYRVTKEINSVTDDDSENGSDEIHQMRAKATVVSIDVDQVKAFDDIEDIDVDEIDTLEQSSPGLETSKKTSGPAKKKVKKGDKTAKEKKGKKKSSGEGDTKDTIKKAKTKKKTVKQRISNDGP